MKTNKWFVVFFLAMTVLVNACTTPAAPTPVDQVASVTPTTEYVLRKTMEPNELFKEIAPSLLYTPEPQDDAFNQVTPDTTGVAEDNVTMLATADPKREEIRQKLEALVERDIALAREMGNKSFERQYTLQHLILKMKAGVDQWQDSFAYSIPRWGKALGTAEANKIGMDVVRNRGFTIEEAYIILNSETWDPPISMPE